MEYAPKGNLKDYLRSNRPLKSPTSSLGEGRTSFDDQTLLVSVVIEEAKSEQILLTALDLINFAFEVASGMEYLASRKVLCMAHIVYFRRYYFVS